MSTRVRVKLEFEWDGDSLPFHVGDNINDFIIGGVFAIAPKGKGNGEVLAGAKLQLTYPKKAKRES